MKFIRFEDRIYNLDILKFVAFGNFDLILSFETTDQTKNTHFYLASQEPTPYFAYIFQQIIWFMEDDKVIYELKKEGEKE